MPQPIGQSIHPALVVTGPQPRRVGAIEIGDVAEFELLKATVLGFGHLAGEGDFQLAKIAVKTTCCSSVSGCSGKVSTAYWSMPRSIAATCVAAEGLANVDAGNLADEAVLNRANIHSVDLLIYGCFLDLRRGTPSPRMVVRRMSRTSVRSL